MHVVQYNLIDRTSEKCPMNTELISWLIDQNQKISSFVINENGSL